MREEHLDGGNMGPVAKAGGTVLRTAGEWTPAVHRLLRHCHANGVDGIPRPHGLTADGREILSFLPGDVPQYPMPEWVWGVPALVSSARLLRELHDASATCDRTGPWRSPTHEPAKVVCHNDFAPHNLVFSGGVATGVIDFDYASPGPRLWDLAYLAYRVVPLSTDRADRFTDDERSRRLDRLIREYGTEFRREHLLEVVVDRLEALADFSEGKAAELSRPELVDHSRSYRLDAQWIRDDLLAGTL